MTVPAPTPGAVAVSVAGLRKRYGARDVLAGLDLAFEPGAVTALLGPNGAGKTTLLKCLLGLVRPTAGAVLVDGSPDDDAGRARRLIGYMPQLPNFPPHRTGNELAEMLDDLRGFTAQPDEDLVDALALRSDLDTPFRALSGGTKQKVNAALAFRYRAPVLVLDEPTAGLDPVASLALKEKVRACRAEGRTVVVTSHNLGELESLADSVVFLHEGRIRFDGSLEALLDQTRRATLEEAIATLMTAEPSSGPPDEDIAREERRPRMRIVR